MCRCAKSNFGRGRATSIATICPPSTPTPQHRACYPGGAEVPSHRHGRVSRHLGHSAPCFLSAGMPPHGHPEKPAQVGLSPTRRAGTRCNEQISTCQHWHHLPRIGRLRDLDAGRHPPGWRGHDVDGAVRHVEHSSRKRLKMRQTTLHIAFQSGPP